MFLRVASVKRMNKSYDYVQIVQAYRREKDGMPAHRVIANLGQISSLEFENLKAALSAFRDSKKVVVARSVGRQEVRLSKPTKNLVYLDLAVLHEIWRQSGIEDVIRESLQLSGIRTCIEKIITILCLQRCQDPGSKLAATRWYATTALPEMMSIPTGMFNNTRLHRALYALEQAQPVLEAKLPNLYNNCRSDCSAFFLDVSDAYFSGAGPSMAKKGICKDGAIRKKIGIVLLCNCDGFPMRWDVVSGAAHDGGVMVDMLDEVHNLVWMKGVPLVTDRAMGKTSTLRKMHDRDIVFLTALTRQEYINYTEDLALTKIRIAEEISSEKELEEKAREAIRKNKKFIEVDFDLFATDLGIVEVAIADEGSEFGAAKKYHGFHIAKATELGRQIRKLLADSKVGSVAAAGASLGLKTGIAHKYFSLTRLPEQVQDDILSGVADNCSINQICDIAQNEKPERMFAAFYRHVDSCNKGPKRKKRSFEQATISNSVEKACKFKVRTVAYFNPKMYADQKTRSQQWLEKIDEFVDDLNRRLSSSNSRRTRDSIAAEIDRFIRKKDLLRCFEIVIDERKACGRTVFQVVLKLKDDEWERRRSFDGLCVLAAHPKCELSAVELCRLYRNKDVVEKDFQTIKSVLQVGPIRHRQDEKVKAHVTICMMSLLLERIMKQRLGGKYSVEEALKILHTCHLNRYAFDEESLYTITEVDKTQADILRQLGMPYLAADEYLIERIAG